MNQKAKWMEDPSVAHIPQEKLEFLGDLAQGGHGKSQREMMMYVMTTMKKAKAKGLIFNPAEIQTIIAAIQKYSTPEELAQMEELMKRRHPL